MPYRYQIETAKSAGFCFGVDRAVKLVYEALAQGKRVATLGPIIHNDSVVNDLLQRGARIIEDVSEADPDETIVIRSHGVGKEVYERLDAAKQPYIDATCPFVSRIHKIVAEQSAKGNEILIAGDATHPEVQGIVGHCAENCTVFHDKTELKCLIDRKLKTCEKPLAIVAQTTYNKLLWEDCIEVLPTEHPDLLVFDTICNATAARQSDADALSKQSDLMIVAGGRHSSNTVKLYDVCRRNCPTWHIAEPQELLLLSEELRAAADSALTRKGRDSVLQIGITAGASTPDHIIKEVQTHMSGIFDTDTTSPESEEFRAAFEEELDKSFRKIRTGDRVVGTVASISGNNEVMVDVGAKQTGIVTLSELTNDSSKKPSDLVKVGDELNLIVIKVNDADGTVQLSKRRVDESIGFENILKAKEADTVLTGTVQKAVKGGLEVNCDGVRVFIPASQSGLGRDADLNTLVKQEVRFVIIDVNEQRKKAVGSIRQVQKSERDAAKSKFWETAKVGDTFTGEVKSLTSYGAFVDLGGIDGMVHVSELSWARIHQPSDVVSVGDTLEVYIKALNPETGRISLGHRRAEDNPWVKFTENYHVDDVVEATVVSVTSFGAFARITDGVDGLIHISQLSNKRVTNVKDVLNVGDTVQVKITEIDTEKKRISLSVRALLEDAAPVEDAGEEVVYSDETAEGSDNE